MSDDFFVPDEPVEDVVAAFEAGEKFVTAPPALNWNDIWVPAFAERIRRITSPDPNPFWQPDTVEQCLLDFQAPLVKRIAELEQQLAGVRAVPPANPEWSEHYRMGYDKCLSRVHGRLAAP